MVNHPNRGKWLKGITGTQFQQFQKYRITRSEFPLGGYIYDVRRSPDDGVTIYSGNDYIAAREAIRAENP